MVLLEDKGANQFQMKIQAMNASMYVFSFAEVEKGKQGQWRVVGYGDSSEVSGGFTGVCAFLYHASCYMLI